MNGSNMCAIQRVEYGAKKAPPTRAVCAAKRAERGVSNDLTRRSSPDVRAYPFRPLLPIRGGLMAPPVWVRTPGYRDDEPEGTLLPPVYDVPPSEWKTFPAPVGHLISGVIDGLEEDIANAGRRVDYHEYLKSEKWAILRRIVRRRAQNRCERCGSTDQRLNVHHLTYARLGAEDLADLVCLCRECHRKEHRINTPDHPYSEDD